jgi:hypothetical protein
MTDRYDNLAKRMECTPEEIPALIQQHAPWSGRDMCNDSIALAAEVERLREMLLNAGWPREAEELAALALRYERAAVVAWLLKLFPDNMMFSFMLNGVARRIACGEHRREEKP